MAVLRPFVAIAIVVVVVEEEHYKTANTKNPHLELHLQHLINSDSTLDFNRSR